tara:strand:+ start:518 stop:1489 length:972 start_codon:yes stop_codon:yes gene_type:complete
MTSEDGLLLLDEEARWRARDVRYVEGVWERLRKEIPKFTVAEFRAGKDMPANPYLQAVVRVPRNPLEQPVPVGVVSKTYTLAQHVDVAERCLEGIREAGFDTHRLRCQVGLTELGEWMNFRVYFPDQLDFAALDGGKMGLRLECFNSVDGSSRLVLYLGWLRFVCANGMVVGTTMAELKDIHNPHMDLDRIAGIVSHGMTLIQDDRERMKDWEGCPVQRHQLEGWVDTDLAKAWGKKAACRIFHICTAGCDVEYADPFAKELPTQKPVKRLKQVPGAPSTAENLYAVSQALSWIATRKMNPDIRREWQLKIPALIGQLSDYQA